MKLLFVCSGNTCRSPLARAAWQKLAREIMLWPTGITVETAGLNARAGARASPLARRVAAAWNVDLSAHRARSWNFSSDSTAADLIVVMTQEQAAQMAFRLDTSFVATHTLGHKPRVVTLGSYAPRPTENTWMNELLGEAPDTSTQNDILDPFGGSFEAYQECGARILRSVRALALSLRDETARQ